MRHVAGSTYSSVARGRSAQRFEHCYSQKEVAFLIAKRRPRVAGVRACGVVANLRALDPLPLSAILPIRARRLVGWPCRRNRHARLHARQTGGRRQGLLAAGRLTRAASQAKKQAQQDNGNRVRPLPSSNVERAIDFRQQPQSSQRRTDDESLHNRCCGFSRQPPGRRYDR